jgi:hypothetical protein
MENCEVLKSSIGIPAAGDATEKSTAEPANAVTKNADTPRVIQFIASPNQIP